MKQNLKFLSFWAINDKMDIPRLNAQLDQMKELGFEGVVWHMRYYPDKEGYLGDEYMQVVSSVILHAKEIGMEFWIYDENGWPSGHCSGKVIEAYPNCKIYWLEPKGKSYKKRSKVMVNIFDDKAMEIFVDLTFNAYRDKLIPEAFQYITGFFSDEVGFQDGHGTLKDKGAIPWCPLLNVKFKEMFGIDPEKDFPLLFAEGAQSDEFRRKYWEALTKVLVDNFYKRIGDWCKKYNKKYTAHLKAEENPYFQVAYSGSCYQNLLEVNVPAVDALERYKINSYFPRIASSIAKQFHSGESLAEALGGSGYGLTPIDFYNYIDWLASCGNRTFVLHISQYCHKSHAIEDWPPDIPFSQTWRDSFPTLIKSLKEKYSNKEMETKNLVVVPTAAVFSKYDSKMACYCNSHNGDNLPDIPSANISKKFSYEIEQFYLYNNDFDVTEEKVIIDKGKWDESGVTIGSQHYTNIYYSEDCYFADAESCNNIKSKGKTLSDYLNNMKDSPKINEYIEGMGVNEKQRVKNQTKLRYKNWNTPSLKYDFKIEGIEENLYKIESKKLGFVHHASIKVSAGEKLGSLKLKFSDPVKNLKINGKPYIAQGSFDKFVAEFEHNGGNIKISYIAPKRDKRKTNPYVFLEGRFLVKNTAEYQPFDYHQLIVDGEFYLESYQENLSSENLIKAGFPFIEKPIIVSADIEFEKELKLSNIYADAYKVKIDGEDLGFYFDSELSIDCPNITMGKHKVELELIPNTYNVFGPHHNYEGDRHLCSPLQFEGIKAFADWPDAPKKTIDKKWRFVKFGI